MEAIFDSQGYVVGWLDTGVIYDKYGGACAFVTDGAVHDSSGAYFGQFDNRLFWDTDGLAVAFMAGARGGPLLPRPEVPPIPPSLSFPSEAPALPTPPANPTTGTRWSTRSWEAFLRG
jgi:hypothetical protein